MSQDLELRNHLSILLQPSEPEAPQKLHDLLLSILPQSSSLLIYFQAILQDHLGVLFSRQLLDDFIDTVSTLQKDEELKMDVFSELVAVLGRSVAFEDQVF